MDWEIVWTALGATGIVSAIVAYFSHRLTSQYDQALAMVQESNRRLLETGAEIDLDLREKRLAAYPALWTLTRILPEWPRTHDRTYEDLQVFSASLRDWYFETGGWLLSSASRKAYGDVQGSLWDHDAGVLWARNGPRQALRTGVIAPTDYDAVRERCSTLRTELTRDLESRRLGPMSEQPKLP